LRSQPIKHGANAAVLLLEVAISRLPMTTTWVIFPLAYTTIYTFFVFIYWAIDMRWPYENIDFRVCLHLAGYVAVPIVVTIVFFILCAFSAPHLRSCAGWRDRSTGAWKTLNRVCLFRVHRLIVPSCHKMCLMCLLHDLLNVFSLDARCASGEVRVQRIRRYALTLLRDRVLRPRAPPAAATTTQMHTLSQDAV
jgi:hypothetical protein